MIISISEAVWRFIGVGAADFVNLSVIICEICEGLNHQQVIINLSEAVWRFIGVGMADFVKLSVIICEICEGLNHQHLQGCAAVSQPG